MLKTLKNLFKQDKEKFVVPKSLQIPKICRKIYIMYFCEKRIAKNQGFPVLRPPKLKKKTLHGSANSQNFKVRACQKIVMFTKKSLKSRKMAVLRMGSFVRFAKRLFQIWQFVKLQTSN